jgi:hypothetical protein
MNEGELLEQQKSRDTFSDHRSLEDNPRVVIGVRMTRFDGRKFGVPADVDA